MCPQGPLACILLALTLGCAGGASSAGGSPPAVEGAQVERLIAALDTVQGEFRDVGHLIFVFDSESRVLEELGQYNELAIPKLVECLGRTRYVRATAQYGGQLRLGTLCYHALAYTEYFQARNDRWPEWFSDSLPDSFDATPDQLQRAKRVWQAYFAQNPLRR